jgi:RND family efflux transporter MFP subunit
MSAKTNSLLLKLLCLLAVLAAAAVLTLRALRPVAIVEPVVSTAAIDAKPGTVSVEEDFAMDLKSEQGGRVLAQDYALHPGDKVREGQVLLQLDPTDLKLLIARDQVAYETTKQNYLTDHGAALRLETEEALQENRRAENRLGSVSAADLAAGERAVKTAQQVVDVEQIVRRNALAGMEYTLKMEQLQLDRMTVHAPPFAMVVKTVYVHPGDLISAQAPLATLITQGKRVVGKISDEDFAEIKVGQSASVFFVPYHDFLFNGKVAKILPTTDPLTQRHIIYLEVTDIADDQLIPGINGEVSVVVNQHPARAVVPRRAVFSLNGDSVFVVKDGRVQLRKVTKGSVWARGIEITQGLEPGENVIVEGTESFHDGQAVAVEAQPSDATEPKP